MNPTQFALQIKHKLESVAWPEDESTSSADVVFGANGSVLVLAGDLDEDSLPAGLPAAVILTGAATADEDHPDLWEQSFGVLILAEVAGGLHGEHSVIGGARPDLGKSAGAGVLEVAAPVRRVLQSMTGVDGAQLQLSASTSQTTRIGRQNRHVAFHQIDFSALCTSLPSYAAPAKLAHAGGVWTWDGSRCEERYDFVRYRLAYKNGQTPPATLADADDTVYLESAATANHPAGTGRTYSVFAEYAQRGVDPRNRSFGDVVGAFLRT